MTDETDLSFYLNFIFLNSSELVKEKVKEKMGGFLGGLAAKAINADSKITDKVSSKLTEAIPVSSRTNLTCKDFSDRNIQNSGNRSTNGNLPPVTVAVARFWCTFYVCRQFLHFMFVHFATSDDIFQ